MFLEKQLIHLNYQNHIVLVEMQAVSLSSGATGTNHTFRSQGIPGKGQVCVNPDMSKYDGA